VRTRREVGTLPLRHPDVGRRRHRDPRLSTTLKFYGTHHKLVQNRKLGLHRPDRNSQKNPTLTWTPDLLILPFALVLAYLRLSTLTTSEPVVVFLL